jgi:hypothetical protein
MTRPTLLIDIDGPLNPWAAKPHRRPEGYGTHRLNPVDVKGEKWTTAHKGKSLRVWLNESHGPALLKLGETFDLVWASTWGPEANRLIGPVLGLPELEYVNFWAVSDRPHSPERVDGVYWKTPLIADWAAGRPFAWIDDEVREEDRAYLADCPGGPTLLHHVSPRLGLLEPDFAVLAAWADSL